MLRFYLCFRFLTAVWAILIPGPSGRYPVAMSVLPFTDKSRIDPYAPPQHPHKRRVIASLFTPIERKSCQKKAVPYMTPEVALSYGDFASAVGLPETTFQAFELEVCDSSKVHKSGEHGKHQHPLVLFSPGFGESRLLYGAMARSLASQGYVVVTVDHPYDAQVVEFPDGTVITAANISSDIPSLSKLVQVRTDDMSFVLDHLRRTTNHGHSPPWYTESIDFGKVIAHGHSLGGATAASVVLKDERVLGGLNLDGAIVGPAASKTFKKPFLQVGRLGHRLTDQTWPPFYRSLGGPKAEIGINGTVHGSYTDFPVLASLFDIPDEVKELVAELIGSIDGKKLDDILNAVVESFGDLVFHNQSKDLERLEKDFTEVTISKSSLDMPCN